MQIIHDIELLRRRTGDVRRGLAALQAQGIGGIVTNVPFTGYLTDPTAWPRLREVLGACRDMGLRVWIYDEKGYPSGYAGGHVLAGHPQFEAQALFYDADAQRCTSGGSYEGTHNCRNYFAQARTANLLDEDAIARFIEVTHERYAAELGPDFAMVEAFFTDEPGLNAMGSPELPPQAGNVPVVDPPDSTRKLLPALAWSEPLARRFAGRDLTGLFTDRPGAAELRREFHAKTGEHLADAFFAQIQQWCFDHEVFSSGHILAEENAAAHVPLYGNFLRCLMKMDIPGIDVLSGLPEDCRSFRRAAAFGLSAALLNGDRRVFSESSDINQLINPGQIVAPAQATASMAWQAALGVTDFASYFNFGLCPELGGAPSNGPQPQPTDPGWWLSISPLQPGWPPDNPRLARTPEEYLAINTAITGLLDQLEPAELGADVFLYYPVELMQEEYRPVLEPWNNGAGNTGCTRIADAYHHALEGLLDAGIIPCLVDGVMLRELLRETAPDSHGRRRYAVMHATASAIVYPAGCEPPADCRPAVPAECYSMAPDLPAKLFARGLTRIIKDNPDICAGVMNRAGHTLVTLVNLTDRKQACRIQWKTGKVEKQLGAYQFVVEELR
jgi:hypothetical protein